MTDYDYLHEAEDVVLRSENDRPCGALWKLLRAQGFTLHEDVFSFDRPTNPPLPIWQSDAFVEVDICNNETELHDPEDKWNKILLTYLLATQPRSGIPVFSRKASDISASLALPMTLRGKVVGAEELEECLNRFADELAVQVGEPGSEDVAIVIRSTYPRRRT